MEKTIGNHNYRSVRLDAKKQFHVARRLGPAVYIVGASVVQNLQKSVAAGTVLNPQDALDTVGDKDLIGALLNTAGPLLDVFSKMSDQDVDYIVDTCLSVVSMQSGQGWQNVLTQAGGIQFEHIDMPTMMQLTIAVIQENLGNFINALAMQN